MAALLQNRNNKLTPSHVFFTALEDQIVLKVLNELELKENTKIKVMMLTICQLMEKIKSLDDLKNGINNIKSEIKESNEVNIKWFKKFDDISNDINNISNGIMDLSSNKINNNINDNLNSFGEENIKLKSEKLELEIKFKKIKNQYDELFFIHNKEKKIDKIKKDKEVKRKLDFMLKDIRLKEVEVKKMKKENLEVREKIKTLGKKNDQVISERNKFKNSLNQEIENKRNLKINFKKQIDNLRKSKNKLNNKYNKIISEKYKKESELNKLKKRYKASYNLDLSYDVIDINIKNPVELDDSAKSNEIRNSLILDDISNKKECELYIKWKKRRKTSYNLDISYGVTGINYIYPVEFDNSANLDKKSKKELLEMRQKIFQMMVDKCQHHQSKKEIWEKGQKFIRKIDYELNSYI